MSVERIQQHFRDSAAVGLEALDALAMPIAAAIDAMFAALANGGKILACGNGGSAVEAQRFAQGLVGGFERERPGLPALALPATADDFPDQVFAKQVRALGQPGDVLFAITASGNPASLIAAIDAAHEREMIVVALTGSEDETGAALADTDIHIGVPSTRAARVYEVHLLTIHCLCDGIDAMLLGDD
ncbi:phosphoheptose isomerase [Burkholderia sp. WAC0059]|uniref:SIS domain-containing protein n=1 Tax=Burkholderia sp. WAC0059 TaxID=2066022 RepID=UPI000C7EB356|nr:SIS domain-containing protein [Burkholderia sp. WAC0059]PLZ02285.1 phosphoheptose isomerase [Burkholderia sp. WAC0059]